MNLFVEASASATLGKQTPSWPRRRGRGEERSPRLAWKERTARFQVWLWRIYNAPHPTRHLLNSDPMNTRCKFWSPISWRGLVSFPTQFRWSLHQEDDHPEWARGTEQGTFPARAKEERPQVGPVTAGDQGGHRGPDPQGEEGLRWHRSLEDWKCFSGKHTESVGQCQAGLCMWVVQELLFFLHWRDYSRPTFECDSKTELVMIFTLQLMN